MNASEAAQETLRLSFKRDELSRLPLLEEVEALLKLTLNHLPLPHSVVEFGCGKKASLILDLLARHGVPVHGLKRGMILERDMSPRALEQAEHASRHHSLHVANPLYQRATLGDDSLRRMLRDDRFGIDEEKEIIQAGDFELHHVETVQFAIARSHIYAIVTLWDPESGNSVDRVIDPTLDREQMFPVPEMRDYLHGPDALLFSAPMLGHFRLDPEHLTERQQQEIAERMDGTDSIGEWLGELNHNRHAELVRDLTGARAGSIGDPETWSYANNIRPSGDAGHDDVQTQDTGVGDKLRPLMLQLRNSRPTVPDGEFQASRERFHDITVELEVRQRMRRDAAWSGKKLEPLARLASVVSSHLSLQDFANSIRRGDDLPVDPTNTDHLQRMRGVAVRLRQRIERLALASTDEDGKINASALTPLFMEAASETIAQMNRAGLTVFIDRVGNLHGLRIPVDHTDLPDERRSPPADFCADAICHASHIDTVTDAGKHDGRLGVMAGIEIAQIAHDLETYFGISFAPEQPRGNLMVTAFMGEEMTYSGEGVSMPGSSAVAGHAPVEAIHRMIDSSGKCFIDGLIEMLRFLEARRREGRIEFANRFPREGAAQKWIDACPPPDAFFTPHTYERHIEQGPELDRAGVPLVLVDRVMGIHQEDVLLQGNGAADAALEFNLRLRELALQPEFNDARVTVGILEAIEPGDEWCPATAWRWWLLGRENHAGSTPTRDRRDAGVAAARLAREFSRHASQAQPAVGDLQVLPGTNRNVIPGKASLTLGAQEHLKDEDADDFKEGLADFVAKTLGRDVTDGGEGVVLEEVRPVETMRNPTHIHLSVDLRAPDRSLLEHFRDKIEQRLRLVAEEYDVDASRETRQKFEPQSLGESGQVLQLERSYGGSHNPNEMEMAVDLLRGTLIQLAVTRDFQLSPRSEDRSLYQMAGRRIPASWKKQLPTFASGALHDSCNIALRSRPTTHGQPSVQTAIRKMQDARDR